MAHAREGRKLTIRIIVRFLKMVYTGMLRNCYATGKHAKSMMAHAKYVRLTRLFEPVYITLTRRKLIGNHVLASFLSKSRKDMIPIFFTAVTQPMHTVDCMHNSKKFIVKCAPETTN